MSLAWIALAVFVLTVVMTGVVLKILRVLAVVDTPNDRSSHTRPTPRGGGLAIAISLSLAWIGLAIWSPQSSFGLSPQMTPRMTPWMGPWIGLAALSLCLVSWLDDLKSLGAGLRLSTHLGACIIGAWMLGPDPIFPAPVPFWLDRVFVVLIWVGFLNFFNFMDGIDGISCIEAAAIGCGLALMAVVPDSASATDPVLPLTIAASALGFLVWNRPPAKLFMGDVGSIPLGFILGWFLLLLAQSGAWAAAILLPAYYFADGGVTLLSRALRGEKIWQAHRQHFYQRAVARRMDLFGLSRTSAHRRVSGAVGLANIGLIACAILSISSPLPALLLGAALVVGLMTWMVR